MQCPQHGKSDGGRGKPVVYNVYDSREQEPTGEHVLMASSADRKGEGLCGQDLKLGTDSAVPAATR